MFKTIAAHRAAVRARRQYELARLESLMAANQRLLDDIERRRNAPCPHCPAEVPA